MKNLIAKFPKTSAALATAAIAAAGYWGGPAAAALAQEFLAYLAGR